MTKETRTLRCKDCGCDTSRRALMCDEELDSEWCDTCFARTPCGQGDHGEGCATIVMRVGAPR